MSALFKGYISIETLGQMPLPFVHILRDLRIKQLEAKRRQNEIMANQMQSQQNSLKNPGQSNPGFNLDESAIEEMIEDGLT